MSLSSYRVAAIHWCMARPNEQILNYIEYEEVSTFYYDDGLCGSFGTR